MAISNLVFTQQIYSEETNGAHAHNRDRVPSSGKEVRSLEENINSKLILDSQRVDNVPEEKKNTEEEAKRHKSLKR